MASDKIVDIIVPIYVPVADTFTILQDCLESIIENTTSNCSYQLILINDCSPLDGVLDYLQSFQSKYNTQRIIVLNNETNQGFVKTVNIGMRYSNNDVLLLNSDTIVTSNWLKKMQNRAYSDPQIATVSPFSNAATILSLPKFCVDNDLPEGYTPNELNTLIEHYFPSLAIDLPTAHGFCMYIKRAILQEIGFFDEEKFGKGYGEENDFSNRCYLKGYINVLDTQTFIYHKGEASFQGKKANVGADSLKKIQSIHPFYEFKVMDFIQRNPLQNFQLAFEHLTQAKQKLTHQKRGNMLVVTHNYDGGSSKYIDDLFSNGIDEFYDIYLLQNEKTQCTLVFPDRVNSLSFNYTSTFYYSNELSNPFISNTYQHIISECNIDIVFVNSFINTTFDVIDICKQNKIPIIHTIHDYNLICPTNNLIDNNQVFCGICAHGDERKNCLKPIPETLTIVSEEMLNAFRTYVKDHVLPHLDLIISPSQNAINYLSSFYKTDSLNYSIIEHGIDSHKEVAHRSISKHTSPRLNIAFVGSIGYHKGLSIIQNITSELKSPIVKFHLFGHSIEPIMNVVNHGSYDSKNLISLLKKNNIDLIILPSICPETFMYTVSEAWDATIPVIVNDIGAPAERVKKTGYGWVFDFSKPYIEELNAIFSNRSNIDLIKEKIKKEYHKVSLANMHQTYLEALQPFNISNSSKKLNKLLVQVYTNVTKETLQNKVDHGIAYTSNKILIALIRSIEYYKINGKKKTLKKVIKKVYKKISRA